MAPPGLVDSAELSKRSDANVNIYTNKFDIGRTVNELDWAVAFWKKQRDAVPTKKAAKCAVCEFKESCGSLTAIGQ